MKLESENKKISLLLPDNVYTGIGILVTQYGQIETILEHILWLLLDTNSTEGRLITSSMSIQPRLKLLAGLIKIKVKNKKTINEVNELKKSIEKVFDKRTIIVHGLWHIDSITNKVCCTLTKEKSSSPDLQNVHVFTFKKLIELSQSLTQIIKNLDNFKKQLQK